MFIAQSKRWLIHAVCLAGMLASVGRVCAEEGPASAASASTPSTAPASAPDERVKPGATFFLEFPNLPKTRHGKLTTMQVCIPRQYDPRKLYPLYAFMGGSDGTSTVETDLVNDDRYVRIALPFPKGSNSPYWEGMIGKFPMVWQYHKAMLDELFKVVPNISPSLRIIAGFSNGGHTLAGLMQLPKSDFLDYFNVYIPVEGGGIGPWWWSGAKGSGLDVRLRGRYACLLWGEKSIGKGQVKPMSEKLERFGVKVTTFAMEDTGHDFPAAYQDKVRDWIKGQAVPGMIAEAMAVVEKAQGGPAAGKAYGLAKSLELAAQNDKDAERIRKQLARLEEIADKRYADLKATVNETGAVSKTPASVLSNLKSLMKEFNGCKASDQCRELLGRLGGPELDKIKAGLAREMTADQRLALAAKLRQFAKDWEGTAPADQCNQVLQGVSEQAFEGLKADIPDSADEAARQKAVPELRKFLGSWEGTSGATKAKAILDSIAAKALDKIKSASSGKLTAPQRDALAAKIIKFQAEWKDTQAAGDAQALLDDFSQQELDEFKGTWPASPTQAQKQAIVAQLKKLQAKWQGSSAADLCDDEIRKLGNPR
jgi:hypothetical protein